MEHLRNSIILTGEEGFALQTLSASTHTVQSNAQREAYKEKIRKEMIFQEIKDGVREGTNFVRTEPEKVKEVSHMLGLNEAGAMFSIMIHLQVRNNDGIIRYDGKPATMSDLEKILGKSKRQTATIVKNLESLSLIFREKKGRETLISVNPAFHFIGAGSQKTVKVYVKKAQSLIGQLTLQELGVLYKMQPWFHYDYMILCKRPKDSDGHTERLSTGDIAELVGVDRKTLERILPKLVSKNAIMRTENGKAVNYIVNPNLFFRMKQDSELTKMYRDVFDFEQERLDKE